MKQIFLCCTSLLLALVMLAQDKSNIKFGKISADDFNKKIYSIDSNASAVILADIGSTEIVGNSKGWFSLEFKRFKRVHIINKNGYDVADVHIPLYTDGKGNEERLDNVKAYTYNLENGKVVETKLEKDNIFKDKLNKEWIVKKFTFPNIKEGSIIEFEYKVTSDFLFNLQPWQFQDEYPTLWSEYTVSIPSFLGYVFLSQGYQKMHSKNSKDRTNIFTVRDNTGVQSSGGASFTAGVTDTRWVMKDVPAIKEESFTSTIENHRAKISFQLSEYKDPLAYRNVMGTWAGLTTELLQAEYFGLSLNKDNGWLGDIVKPIINGANDELEKAKRIYRYVRDNFTCTDYSALYLDQTLKNVLRSKRGNVAEINLLLTAMLRYADIYADPVLLSTRGHGYTMQMYPLIDKFNYVICQVKSNANVYYLDASHPLGFGRLTTDSYNGHARVINMDATPIELNPDSLQEKKLTSIFIVTDEKGNLKGRIQQLAGYNESYMLRTKIKEKGQDEFLKDIRKAFGSDIEITNPHIDSLKLLDEAIGINYEFALNIDKEDIIYLNPMFGEGYKENYFKAAERNYPVEMPYVFDETYVLNLDVPTGYTVDELPKSIMVKLNEQNEGMFEYRIQESNGRIALRSRVRIQRAYFLPEEYEMLREFFNLIVKKHSEQIVFKKKK